MHDGEDGSECHERGVRHGRSRGPDQGRADSRTGHRVPEVPASGGMLLACKHSKLLGDGSMGKRMGKSTGMGMVGFQATNKVRSRLRCS